MGRWGSEKVGRFGDGVQGTGQLKITDGVGEKVRGVGDLAGGQEASSTGLGGNARQQGFRIPIPDSQGRPFDYEQYCGGV